MARAARIFLIAAGLSACFAAVGFSYPFWVEDEWTGGSWTTRRAVCAINDSLAWAVGEYWSALRRVDNSLYSHHWEEVSLGSTRRYYLNDVFFTDPQHGWIVGERWFPADSVGQGIILRTADGGQNWEDRTQFITWPPNYTLPTPFYAVRFANQFVGYIACGNGYVLRTDDGGQTWAPTDSMPSSQADSLSECYRGLWVDPGNPDRAWVCGDNSAVIAKTQDGGANWEEYRDTAFDFYYPGPDIDGKLANFDLSATSSDSIDIGLCNGKVGRTADGGSNWSILNIGPQPTWFYGVDHGLPDTIFAVGNFGACYRYPGGVENISARYDFLAVDASPSSPIAYAVGAPSGSYHPVVQRYDPAGFVFDSLTVRRAGPDSSWAIVTVNWHTTFENNIHLWRVGSTVGNCFLGYSCLGQSIDPHGPHSTYQYVDTLREEPPAWYCPKGEYWYQIRMQTNDGNYFQYYFAASRDIWWLPDTMEAPGPPQNLVARDSFPDQGHQIVLSWDPPGTGYVYEYAIGRSRSSGGPYWYIGWPNVDSTTHIDRDVETGTPYWYVVAAYGAQQCQLSPFSNQDSAVATDDIAPDQIDSLAAWHDTVNAVNRLRWEPVTTEPNMGGYWVCCPCLPPGEPELPPPGDVLNASPIDRTWYNTQVDHGGNWGYKVGAMDRAGRFSGWYPPGTEWVEVRVPYISTTDNIKASAHNSARRMIRDNEGNIHVAFTSGDSVYYSWSPNEVHWYERQAIGEGACPAIDLSGNTLHFCWVNKSTQGDAELWYRSIVIPSESPGPSPQAPLFTASESGYYGASPPSLDVEGTNARVAWQSLKPVPQLGPPYPASEEQISLDALGSFLLCGSFDTDAPSGFTYEEVDSFWQGPCTVVLDTLMEHTPSVACDLTGAYILWEHDGSELHYYEKTWEGWYEEVISSPSAYRVKDPQIVIETGIIRCVWAERAELEAFNIFHRDRASADEAATSDWYRLHKVCATPANSECPVFSKNNIAWHESSGGVTEVYLSQYRSLVWTTPTNISNSSYGDSKYPQIIYVEAPPGQSPYLYVEWSQRHPTCHTVQFRKRTVELASILAVDLGGEEPSPVTVQRDGYIHYGSEPHQTVDYGDNPIICEIGKLEGADYLHEIRLLYYHEGEAREIEADIDGIWQKSTWVEPHMPTWEEDFIPDECLSDSNMIVEVTSSSSPDSRAEFSGFELYRYERGSGGGQSAGGGSGLPRTFTLCQNYPNPLAQFTIINYQLPKPSHASLRIYDVTGRLVRILVDEEKEAGYCSVRWDGRNSSGVRVASGIYFYRLSATNHGGSASGGETGSFRRTCKMTVLR